MGAIPNNFQYIKLEQIQIQKYTDTLNIGPIT